MAVSIRLLNVRGAALCEFVPFAVTAKYILRMRI